MMSTRAEWWRARAGELTCDAIRPSKDRAATLAVDRSHSLMLSDGLAQLCSSARHAVHTLLEHLRVMLPDLENLRAVSHGPQIFRGAASYARERSVYRKSDLRRIATHSQIPASYIWTYSFSRPVTRELQARNRWQGFGKQKNMVGMKRPKKQKAESEMGGVMGDLTLGP